MEEEILKVKITHKKKKYEKNEKNNQKKKNWLWTL